MDIRRKIARLIVGTILIYSSFIVFSAYGIEVVRNILLVMTLCTVAADYFRLNFGAKVPFLEPFVFHKYEEHGFSGVTFAALGVLLALSFSDFDIAITAVAMFIYGDALAGIFGRLFGKLKIMGKNKTMVGAISMLATNVLVGFIMLHDIPTAIFMSLLATLVEVTITIPADDFAIPLFAALGGQFFGAVMGVRSYLEGFTFGLIFTLVSVSGAIIAVYGFNWIAKPWQKKSST